MCGIWGYQFKAGLSKHYDSFTSRSILCAMMMRAMDVRGDDSYGFAVLDTSPPPSEGEATGQAPPSIKIVKGVGASSEKVDPQLVAGFHQVMAHTRKATSGSICEANAHPFHVKHIIGMHNGSVSNEKLLNARFGRSCDVDSEHIFHHLANDLPLTELNLYGTIVYQNETVPDEINFLRTTSGQLEIFGIVEDGADKDAPTIGLVWASNDFELKRVLPMIGLTNYAFVLKPEYLYQARSGTLIDAGKTAIGFCYIVNSNADTSALGLRDKDWTERYHPLLETMEICTLNPDGSIKNWILDKRDLAFIARVTKRKAKADAKATKGNGGGPVVTPHPGHQRKCAGCGMFVDPVDMRFCIAMHGWMCNLCDGERGGFLGGC